MSRIAVIGASGFVGAAFVESLIAAGEHDVVPVIRSPGNAWRLSRHSIDLRTVDILSSDGLDESLRDVDFVVNCSRGSKAVMLDGLSNLLDAAKKNNVKRFVHLSSVMIYGDPPVGESEDVEPVKQSLDTYGGLKLRQDEMIAAAARRGLSSCILVPPNISGPYSAYVLGILNAVNAGEFALMDGGSAPLNLVDVENLCHAIELALTNGNDDGSRYFITDDEDTTWGDVISDLQELQMTDVALNKVTCTELQNAVQKPGLRKTSFSSSLKHLVSSDMREALRKDPFWEKFDRSVRGLVGKMGSSTEEKLRLSIEGPAQVSPRVSIGQVNMALSGQQLREGRHSIDKARRDLKYSPIVSYEHSMTNFKKWYRSLHALDGEFAALLKELYF